MEKVLDDARQALVAVAETWDSVSGKLFRSTKGKDGRWRQEGPGIDVDFGVHGLVWSTEKLEGDGKSPAGVFGLGPVYGREPRANAGNIRMEYSVITPGLEAVDDPKSLYYNQIVDKDAILACDWLTSEKMSEIDLYDLVVSVQHNWPERVPNRGSAIFLHRWRVPGEGTAGCTAMDLNELRKLVEWLDPEAQPVMVQMPKKFAFDLLKIKFN